MNKTYKTYIVIIVKVSSCEETEGVYSCKQMVVVNGNMKTVLTTFRLTLLVRVISIFLTKMHTIKTDFHVTVIILSEKAR